MALNRYSATLPAYSGSIENVALAESLNNLGSFLGQPLPQLSWSDTYMAIPVVAAITLPPLGTYEGIDIREQEPVLIVLDLKHYPDVAPRVYPDRLDFPKDQLAHLYIATSGRPPAFCLVRGSLTEWYANKQLKDLVIRTQNWLRDAAVGELTEDGDQFEPLRLEGYRGTVTYDYDLLATIVHENQSYFPDQNFSLAFFEENKDEETISFKLLRVLTPATFKEAIDDTLHELKKVRDDSTKKRYHFGYVVWSTSTQTFARYSVHLPNDWQTFQAFCEDYSIDLTDFEEQLTTYFFLGGAFFPVIAAVKRPKPLIGFSSTIEFINLRFEVSDEDIVDGHISSNFPVAFQAHNQPLSIALAERLSGFSAKLPGFSVVYGCGALGSKVVMHLARSGSTLLFLVDPDSVSPHNMVRYVLTAESVGLNKAFALKQSIQRMYPSDDCGVLSFNKSSSFIQDETLLKVFDWVFDFTASHSFLTSLVKAPIDVHSRVCRAFLTDGGDLGILFLEGSDRNPRLDDLQTLLYAASGNYPFIAEWLRHESGSRSTDILVRVGVGCNSETTILADDLISLHAAHFSGIIKTTSQQSPAVEGKIYLNLIRYEPEFTNQTFILRVPPLDVLRTRNESGWEIRVKSGLLNCLKAEMVSAMPHETGGVLIGCANYKTKTIHVVNIIQAPPDSKANPVCFFRGVDGLPEQIASVHDISGGQLGYIGEWHSHPFGPNALSETDLNTVQQFKAEFSQLPSPLPVFLLVLTPDEVLPYVY